MAISLRPELRHSEAYEEARMVMLGVLQVGGCRLCVKYMNACVHMCVSE